MSKPAADAPASAREQPGPGHPPALQGPLAAGSPAAPGGDAQPPDGRVSLARTPSDPGQRADGLASAGRPAQAAGSRWSPLRLMRRLYDWVLHWAETPYAIPALFILAFAESSFFPIPPDVLLIALAIGLPRKSLRFAAYCTLASVLGGMLGYAIGHYGWAAASDLFFTFVPGFTPAQFGRVQGLYQEWGVVAVFVAGFSPIPYKVFTIASGVFDLSFWPFVGASLVGRAGRFFLVAGLIMAFGGRIKTFIDRYFNLLAIVFSVLLVGGFVLLKYVR